MKIKWLGHSCFIIEGNDRVIIDPYITGNPSATVKVEDIDVDIVAVTHAHGDHFGDTIEIAKNARLVAMYEIVQYAAKYGIEGEGINIGGSIKIGKTEIAMTTAFHSSGFPMADFKFCGATAAGLVIKSGKTVYHAGDTSLFSDMKLIGELYEPDVALLPIGGRFTMDARQAAMAAEWIKAKITIPMHYNTWDVIKQDANEFKRMAEERGAKVVILNPGEEVEI
ncbi:MAG: metal-dependent hydrolase [Thermoplasmata archaeon]|nr:metal-dependent hydrolase [Thermoplasmata archaeon]